MHGDARGQQCKQTGISDPLQNLKTKAELGELCWRLLVRVDNLKNS